MGHTIFLFFCTAALHVLFVEFLPKFKSQGLELQQYGSRVCTQCVLFFYSHIVYVVVEIIPFFTTTMVIKNIACGRCNLI